MDLRVSGLGLEAKVKEQGGPRNWRWYVMAVLGFSDDARNVVSLRKAIFRMILSRAKSHLTDAGDIHELNVSRAAEGISFELLAADQRARLAEAVYQGTRDLKREVDEGKATEEPVRAGIEEKLDEILALLSRFHREDRETCSR